MGGVGGRGAGVSTLEGESVKVHRCTAGTLGGNAAAAAAAVAMLLELTGVINR